MPGITDYRQQEVCKMLIMGEQGSGKTCAIAALANAGYKCRILDFDNKLTAMRDYLRPEAWANVHFKTLTDALTLVGGLVIPKTAPASTDKAHSMISNWKDGEDKFGPVSSWGPEAVIVMDSLTFQGHSAMRRAMYAEGRSGQQPFPGDWGEAQRIQRGFLEFFFSEAVKCHVVVISHITYMGGREEGTSGIDPGAANKFQKTITDTVAPGSPVTAYPSGLGRAMPPHVGEYFDSVVYIEPRIVGGQSRRYIITESGPYMPLKNPAPRTMPKELLLEVDKDGYAVNGLAKFFEIVLTAHAKQKEAENAA